MTKLEQAVRQAFETWWEREGQEFLFALNTTTDDDIKLVAEVAWKNGAYCAEQAEQKRKYGELAGTHNWTPPNYTDEQWQKLDQEYQDHVAEQEPIGYLDESDLRGLSQGNAVWLHPEDQGRMVSVYAAPVRTKDLTDDEMEKAFCIGGCRAVIAADREKNK